MVGSISGSRGIHPNLNNFTLGSTPRRFCQASREATQLQALLRWVIPRTLRIHVRYYYLTIFRNADGEGGRRVLARSWYRTERLPCRSHERFSARFVRNISFYT